MSNSNNAATKRAKENAGEVRNAIAGDSKNSAVNEIKQKMQLKADQVIGRAGDHKEKVSANTAGAAQKVQEKSVTAQDFLSDKADVIDDYAQQTVEKLNQIGQKAFETLANSSDYFRNFDIVETRQRVKDTIKNKPELSIAIAGVFGLLIGLLIRRKN